MSRGSHPCSMCFTWSVMFSGVCVPESMPGIYLRDVVVFLGATKGTARCESEMAKPCLESGRRGGESRQLLCQPADEDLPYS